MGVKDTVDGGTMKTNWNIVGPKLLKAANLFKKWIDSGEHLPKDFPGRHELGLVSREIMSAIYDSEKNKGARMGEKLVNREKINTKLPYLIFKAKAESFDEAAKQIQNQPSETKAVLVLKKLADNEWNKYHQCEKDI